MSTVKINQAVKSRSGLIHSVRFVKRMRHDRYAGQRTREEAHYNRLVHIGRGPGPLKHTNYAATGGSGYNAKKRASILLHAFDSRRLNMVRRANRMKIEDIFCGGERWPVEADYAVVWRTAEAPAHREDQVTFFETRASMDDWMGKRGQLAAAMKSSIAMTMFVWANDEPTQIYQ